MDREQQHEAEPDDEGRHGPQDGRDREASRVERAAGAERHEGAERWTDDSGEREGHDGEAERIAELMREFVQHRIARHEGDAEVQRREVDEPGAEADVPGTVEAEFLAHGFRSRGADEIVAVAACGDTERLIAGQRLGEQEARDADDQRDEQGLAQPGQENAGHWAHRIADSR